MIFPHDNYNLWDIIIREFNKCRSRFLLSNELQTMGPKRCRLCLDRCTAVDSCVSAIVSLDFNINNWVQNLVNGHLLYNRRGRNYTEGSA